MLLSRRAFIGAVCSALALLLTAAALGIAARPALGAWLAVLAALIGASVVLESKGRSLVHRAFESENRFWAAAAAALTAALLFAPDSPIAFGRARPLVALGLCVAAAWAAFHRSRSSTRGFLDRRPAWAAAEVPGESEVAEEVDPRAAGAEEAANRLRQLLRQLDFASVSLKPFEQRQIREAQEAVLATLRGCSKPALNRVLAAVSLPLLMYKVKDWDVLAPAASAAAASTAAATAPEHPPSPSAHAPAPSPLPPRSALLQLLCVERAHDLTPRSRGLVLDALQRLRLSAHARGEELAASVLCSTPAADLPLLKTLLDARGSAETLHKLVWRDMHSEAVRGAVLAHIDAAARSGAAPRWPALWNQHGAPRRVLSDVDDTLLSSGGAFPAGVDARFPRRAVYPGAVRFLEELQLDGEQARDGHWPDEWPGALVFLSARPRVYKDLAEQASLALFASLRASHGMRCAPALLPGTLGSGIEMVFGSCDALARQKAATFVEYARLFPESRFVFVGDNGQGDVLAGAAVAAQLGARVEGLFFHLVQPLEATPGYSPAALAQWRQLGAVFFKTYVGAATAAARRGLLCAAALRRVALAAHAEMQALRFRRAEAREQAREALDDDLALADTVLRELDGAAHQPLPALPAPCIFAVGAAVWLPPFGPGAVVGFRASDGVYTVELRRWLLREGRPALAFARGGALAAALAELPTDAPVLTSLGVGVLREVRASDGGQVVTLCEPPPPPGEEKGRRAALAAAPVTVVMPASAVLRRLAAVPGDAVATPMGAGAVRGVRPQDDVYEVRLAWGAVGFFNAASVRRLPRERGGACSVA
jgi:hypothetical protein